MTFSQGDVTQKRLNELYADTIEIMVNNQSMRNEEFDRARNLKLNIAENTVKAIVRGRGTVYQSDLVKIANASGKWFTAVELRTKIDYLMQQGAKIIDDTKRSFDFLTYDKIEKYLKTIGKNDLYDLLNASSDTSIDSLLNAITTLYHSVSEKRDSKSQAINQISGEAKQVFSNDNSKKHYDIYLATKVIWNEFALRKSVGITEIELKEFLNYSEQMKVALKTSDIGYIETLLAEGLNYFRLITVGRLVAESEQINKKDSNTSISARLNEINSKLDTLLTEQITIKTEIKKLSEMIN
jgi:hypothetical protein